MFWLTALLISCTASVGACIGRVPRPTNRDGCLSVMDWSVTDWLLEFQGFVCSWISQFMVDLATVAARSSLINLHRSRVSSGFACLQIDISKVIMKMLKGVFLWFPHPITEHDRHSWESLYCYPISVHLCNSRLNISTEYNHWYLPISCFWIMSTIIVGRKYRQSHQYQTPCQSVIINRADQNGNINLFILNCLIIV